MIFSHSARSKRSDEHQGLLFWDMITSDYYHIIRLLLILSTIKIYQFWTILIGLDRAKVCYLDIPYHDTNCNCCNCNYQNLRTLIPLHCVKRHAIWIHNESMQISQPKTIKTFMWLSKSQDFGRFTLSVYRHDSWIQIKVKWAAKSHFGYIKIQHDSDTWRTQSKWVMFIHFLCLRPLPKTLNKHVYQFSLFVSSKSRHHAEL